MLIKKDCMLMIHVNYKVWLNALILLYREGFLDSICVNIEPPLTTCTSYENGIVKEPDMLSVRMYNRHYSIDHVEELIPELHKIVPEVILKQDNMGYSIGADLQIIKEWELDDGGC